jgi:hypothetical protein
MSKTKNGFTKEFLSQVTNLKNSYLLSFATINLLNHDNVLTILKEYHLKTGGLTFNFSDISNLVQQSKQKKNKDFEILTWEYLMFSTRSLLLYLYEGFKNDEIRYEKVKEEDWFVFLANLRRSLAHGMDAIWDIKDYGKSEIFYIRKNDNTKIIIDKEWDRTYIKLDQVGGWYTIIDIINFIESEVTKFTQIQ